MTLVAFLETRIAEQEIDIPDGTAPPSLTKALADERLEKRAILTAWKAAAEAEGITDPAHAQGAISIARRSMLMILAASYKNYPG
jgi:hypothetical protein